MDHSLVTITTWSRNEHHVSSVDTAAAVLCSLGEYLSHRKLLFTPFVSISLPDKSLLPVDEPDNGTTEVKTEPKRPTRLFSKFKNFLERTAQGTNSVESQREDFKRYSSILRFQTPVSTPTRHRFVPNLGMKSEGDPQTKRSGVATGRVMSESDDSPRQEKIKKNLQRSQSDLTDHRPELKITDKQQTPDCAENLENAGIRDMTGLGKT